MKKYDIFLSYRHEGGWETAKHLYDLLKRDGYSVSFDINTLQRGPFNKELLKRIIECTDFIVVLDEHVFDRTLDGFTKSENDWLRTELAYAIKYNKNIIPVMLQGFKNFPDNLPDDIKNVSTFNAPKYNNYFFDTFYDNLKNDFIISRPNSVFSFITKPLKKIINKLSLSFSSNKTSDKSKNGEKDRIEFTLDETIYNYVENHTEGKDEPIKVELSVEEMCSKGEQYYLGSNVARDYTQAVYWFKKAAELHSPEAMFRLGYCYDQGTGIEQDYRKAAYWYQKAAERGDVYAMFRLGVCYESGLGTAKDYRKAAYWFQKSAEKGNVEAMALTGYHYHRGLGVEQNYNDAVYWFTKSAEKGCAPAMMHLAYIYESGQGVALDLSVANKLKEASEVAKAGNEAHAIEMVKQILK